MRSKEVYFIVAWVILALIFLIVYFISRPISCDTYGCFEESMRACSPASYINEETEVSWKYEVVGSVGRECRVDVTLLMAKEGDLGLREYEGNSMDCYFPLGFANYPDEDLKACSCELKEKLQERIIEKLHQYLLDGLDDALADLG